MLHDDVIPGEAPDWAKWLAAAGATGVRAERGPRYSHSSLVLQAAIDGQGVALGRSTLVALDLEAGRLVRPFGATVHGHVDDVGGRAFVVPDSGRRDQETAFGARADVARRALVDGVRVHGPGGLHDAAPEVPFRQGRSPL